MFAASFNTFGMQNHGMVIFVMRCFRKEILKKAVSGRWCMDSSSLCHRKDRSLTRPYPENYKLYTQKARIAKFVS